MTSGVAAVVRTCIVAKLIGLMIQKRFNYGYFSTGQLDDAGWLLVATTAGVMGENYETSAVLMSGKLASRFGHRF